MAKNKHTSLRYSEEVGELLEQVEGKSFSDKFENIVLDYFKTIAERQEKLEKLEIQINEKNKILETMKEEEKVYKVMQNKFNRLHNEINTLSKLINM